MIIHWLIQALRRCAGDVQPAQRRRTRRLRVHLHRPQPAPAVSGGRRSLSPRGRVSPLQEWPRSWDDRSAESISESGGESGDPGGSDPPMRYSARRTSRPASALARCRWLRLRHVEILYDIDILGKRCAQEKDCAAKRTASVNTHPPSSNLDQVVTSNIERPVGKGLRARRKRQSGINHSQG